jgi:hypothetical protein
LVARRGQYSNLFCCPSEQSDETIPTGFLGRDLPAKLARRTHRYTRRLGLGEIVPSEIYLRVRELAAEYDAVHFHDHYYAFTMSTVARTTRLVPTFFTAYDCLLEKLKVERIPNINETGHRDCAKRMWTWCFRSRAYSVFPIDTSRGSQVLLDVLGKEFDGVIGCYYRSAYHKFRGLSDCAVQFCFVHLFRDIRYLNENTSGYTRGCATGLLNSIRKLFAVIHRRDELGDRFAGELEDAAMQVLCNATTGVPTGKKART